MSPGPSLGAAWGGGRGGARACCLPAGSELRAFPVRSRVRDERGLRPRSSQSARAPWRPKLREGAGRAKEWGGRGSHPSPRAAGPGSSGVTLPKIHQGVPAPTSLRLLWPHCPLAPCAPGLEFAPGASLGVASAVASLASGGPPCSPPPRPGRPAGSSQPRTCISESSRAPLLAPDARGAGPRRASVQGGWTRPGEELVIACSGTMLTFEPLTTKQTTLVLSLHCPNRVY